MAFRTVVAGVDLDDFDRVRLEQGVHGLRAEVLSKDRSHVLGTIARAPGFKIVNLAGTGSPDDLKTVYLFPWRK